MTSRFLLPVPMFLVLKTCYIKTQPYSPYKNALTEWKSTILAATAKLLVRRNTYYLTSPYPPPGIDKPPRHSYRYDQNTSSFIHPTHRLFCKC